MWRYRFVLNRGAFKIGHVIESESSKKEHTMHWMNGMRAKKGNYLFDVVRSHLPFFPLFLSLFVHSHFSHKYYPLGFGFVRMCALAIYFERHTANAKIDETSAGEVIFHYKSMSDSSQASKQRTYSLWNIFSFWFYSTTCFSLLLMQWKKIAHSSREMVVRDIFERFTSVLDLNQQKNVHKLVPVALTSSYTT